MVFAQFRIKQRYLGGSLPACYGWHPKTVICWRFSKHSLILRQSQSNLVLDKVNHLGLFGEIYKCIFSRMTERKIRLGSSVTDGTLDSDRLWLCWQILQPWIQGSLLPLGPHFHCTARARRPVSLECFQPADTFVWLWRGVGSSCSLGWDISQITVESSLREDLLLVAGNPEDSWK